MMRRANATGRSKRSLGATQAGLRRTLAVGQAAGNGALSRAAGGAAASVVKPERRVRDGPGGGDDEVAGGRLERLIDWEGGRKTETESDGGKRWPPTKLFNEADDEGARQQQPLQFHSQFYFQPGSAAPTNQPTNLLSRPCFGFSNSFSRFRCLSTRFARGGNGQRSRSAGQGQPRPQRRQTQAGPLTDALIRTKREKSTRSTQSIDQD